MPNNKLITIGKWFLIVVLASGNFMSYMINETRINIILLIVILIYGFYEFFNRLSGKKYTMSFKLYLFFFYLLSNISFLLGHRALISDQFQMAFICLLFFIGDILLILYMQHKQAQKD